ncbi:Gldg family protein [Sphingopyxis sp. R3-92]|uniref:Gldg family protein n=1 Tax=Sphingopyxis sp. R3-92 TaxID=3158553 RepID=UPI003EE661A0
MAAWRPPMLRAVVVAVLAALLAWTAGGQALLGRIDPALAVPLLMLPMLLLGWWQRDAPAADRRRTLLFALFLLVAGQSLLAITLAGSFAGVQLLLVLAAAGLAGWIADALAQRRAWGRGLRLVVAALLVTGWFAAGHALLAALYRPAPIAADAPAVTMLTSLPLRWAGGGDIAAMIADGPGDDAALTRLQSTGPVALVDSLVDHVPPRGGAVLLAHPRALAPRELVAIDAFVRGGGRAVILADALSGWPASYPLGDPRNPPVTSLLTPLFDHWRIALGAAPAGEVQAVPVDVGEARLRLFSAGRFDRLPASCRAFAGRRVAHCRIGQGDAWLVGDADLIFAPLWQPAVPGAAHLAPSDTMEWLAMRLWGDAAIRAPLRPLWIRTPTE